MGKLGVELNQEQRENQNEEFVEEEHFASREEEPTSEQLAEAGAEAEKALKELERQGSSDSTLSRYFREMATHSVMGQEEELGTAVEVERAEVEHWCAILAFLPAAEHALDALEADLPKDEEAIDLPQIAELRKYCKTYKKQRNRFSPRRRPRVTFAHDRGARSSPYARRPTRLAVWCRAPGTPDEFRRDTSPAVGWA